MATAQNGRSPGRGAGPARQSPSPARMGAGPGTDPTEEGDQDPGSIFGIPLSNTSTGATGSAGAGRAPADVTIEPGQLGEGLSGVTGSQVTDTGAPGGRGTVNSGGGQTVTYTPPGYNDGSPYREASEQGVISGTGDWTQANSDGYAAGPTLPGLENARPVSTGAGRGRPMHGGRST